MEEVETRINTKSGNGGEGGLDNEKSEDEEEDANKMLSSSLT